MSGRRAGKQKFAPNFRTGCLIAYPVDDEMTKLAISKNERIEKGIAGLDAAVQDTYNDGRGGAAHSTSG